MGFDAHGVCVTTRHHHLKNHFKPCLKVCLNTKVVRNLFWNYFLRGWPAVGVHFSRKHWTEDGKCWILVILSWLCMICIKCVGAHFSHLSISLQKRFTKVESQVRSGRISIAEWQSPQRQSAGHSLLPTIPSSSPSFLPLLWCRVPPSPVRSTHCTISFAKWRKQSAVPECPMQNARVCNEEC